MTRAPQNFWETLFASPAKSGRSFRVQMRLLRKGGRPFLLLPEQARSAAATMDLYPAQTGRARAARMVLRWLLRASLAPGAERVSITVALDDPFAKFLSSQAEEPGKGLPLVGILAGNPMSAGQRLLVLVFDAAQRPVAVVKAGHSEEAKALIEKEAAFLAAVPAGTPAAPKLRATFQSVHWRALALEFFAGNSPRPHQAAALAALLESWIDPKRTVKLSETPDWARLKTKTAGSNGLLSIADKLGSRTVPGTISHGDFAPWNIKVSPAGIWTVLDWERGELIGIPGWDWFHYVIQGAILVERLPTSVLIHRVEALLASDAFRQYAQRAGITGCERALVQGYLLHVVEVLKPSEGLEPTQNLLHALSDRWR